MWISPVLPPVGAFFNNLIVLFYYMGADPQSTDSPHPNRSLESPTATVDTNCHSGADEADDAPGMRNLPPVRWSETWNDPNPSGVLSGIQASNWRFPFFGNAPKRFNPYKPSRFPWIPLTLFGNPQTVRSISHCLPSVCPRLLFLPPVGLKGIYHYVFFVLFSPGVSLNQIFHFSFRFLPSLLAPTASGHGPVPTLLAKAL